MERSDAEDCTEREQIVGIQLLFRKKEIFVHVRIGKMSFSRKGSIKRNLQDMHAGKTKVNNL